MSDTKDFLRDFSLQNLSGIILNTYCMRYLHAMPSFFVLAFLHLNTFKLACCLEGFHLQVALNLLKNAPFYLYHMHALSLKHALPV